jgi:tetratricopeptide (TPR) repeat protein
MTDQFVRLHDWYEGLRKAHGDREIIEEIKHRMEAESDGEAARSLAFILATEFHHQKRYGEAENILLKLSEQNPVEPSPLISLAEQKLYYEERPDEALEIIDRAIGRARASGNFRRNALGVKARIAEKLRRYDLIAEVMREIMTINLAGSRIDVGIERDFVDRLPAGVVDSELLKQYDEFCRRAR